MSWAIFPKVRQGAGFGRPACARFDLYVWKQLPGLEGTKVNRTHLSWTEQLAIDSAVGRPKRVFRTFSINFGRAYRGPLMR